MTTPWDNARADDALHVPSDPRFGGVESSEAASQTGFSGRRWAVFWLSLRLGVLTVLTLGFYRFWMKSRLRRWYWSAWRPLGTPLEYVGDPWEKLLGFFIAVVILAFYIGIVNLLLMFASFSLFQSNFAAYLLSFLGVVPLWFFAKYRARRYVLARSRWRGIRFGLAPGAWGYAGRALIHWGITLLSLGLLWPRKAYYLEKYVTDRTYFGDQPLLQTGGWKRLMRPYLGVWLALVCMALLIGLVSFIGMQEMDNLNQILAESDGTEAEKNPFAEWVFDVTTQYPEVLVAFAVLLPIFVVLTLTNYNLKRMAHLHSHKSLGASHLSLKPRYWRVLGIYIGGYTLAGLVVMGLLIPMSILATAMMPLPEGGALDFGLPNLPDWAFTAGTVLLYFLIFLMWSVLTHAFIRFPLMRHYASTMVIHDPRALEAVTQRPRDEFGEAEGFAEALDVGAAI